MSDESTDYLDLFIGSKSSYEDYKREKHIDVREEEEEDKQELKPVKKEKTKVSELSKDTLKEISDETLTMLKRTFCIHDYEEIYMQSSLDFYDEFYNDVNISDELKEVRQIRRVYKIYSDYLNAMEIRDKYIDSIIEKYGGENLFYQKLSMGLVKDWIPQTPVLSKKSPDYEMYLSGVIPSIDEVLPEGSIEEVMDEMSEELKDVELEKDFGIVTEIGMVNYYNEIMDDYLGSYGIPSRRSNPVTVSDLNELNRVFASWYKKDTGTTEHELFKNAPENIKKRFLSYCSYNEPGLLAKIGKGEEIEEPIPDPNEMVHDSVTGKSMTRRELENRQLIRLLAKNGWSESRLRNYMNIGSKLERMTRKKKVSRKRRKRSGTDETAFDSMNNPTGLDSIYSENESISDAFMRLMNGEG